MKTTLVYEKRYDKLQKKPPFLILEEKKNIKVNKKTKTDYQRNEKRKKKKKHSQWRSENKTIQKEPYKTFTFGKQITLLR